VSSVSRYFVALLPQFFVARALMIGPATMELSFARPFAISRFTDLRNEYAAFPSIASQENHHPRGKRVR